jgi:hypothetical protein
MAATCCLYTAKLFVSPVYPLFIILGIIGFAIIFVKHERFSLPLDSKILLVFLAYATLSEIYYHTVISTYINLATGGVAYILIRGIKRFDSSFWETRLLLAARIFATLATADTIYRLTHPQAPSSAAFDTLYARDEGRFYLYKFGSLMFADSNTTAIISVIFLFSILALDRCQRENRKLVMIYMVMIALSLSRAAMIATAIMLIFHSVRQRLLLIVVLTIFGFAFGIFFLTEVEQDGSFLTKFDIAHRIVEYYGSSPAAIGELLFGIGYDNSIEAIGVYTHILVATILFEGGLLSLVLYVLFLVTILKRSRSVRLPISAVLILSMSYFLYVGGPFFYVIIAFLINYDRSKSKEQVIAGATEFGRVGNKLSLA